MNRNIKGLIVCMTSYIIGRLIGGLWAYLNPDKAEKVYTGFVNMIRRVTGGFIKKAEKKGCDFGHIFNSKIPVTQTGIEGRETEGSSLTAEDRAILEAALTEVLRKAENLGNVVSLKDLEAGE